MKRTESDVCLILEGSYPFVSGGVSSWTHDLIHAQKDRSFHLWVLVPRDEELRIRYELPKNVTGMTRVVLGDLPRGRLSARNSERFWEEAGGRLSAFLRKGGIDRMLDLIQAMTSYRRDLGSETLLESRPAWNFLLGEYLERFPDNSFLDYFWTWRSMIGSFFSVMLCPMPRADLYHPVSTGYAGLLASRAHLETGRPVILTEHGIYTNERRIEIAMANWIYEVPREGLGIDHSRMGLKELWIEAFAGYSRTCYEACSEIVTLYEGNQKLQIEEGADPKKLRIIPNGIDFERFYSLVPERGSQPPTVALIGRVVPIKDVKTFIRAGAILRKTIPDLRILILGPTEEDPGYFQECREMVELLNLENSLEFTGKVRLDDYLPRIDVMALTSISEAQPLVILEAGAAGIPVVATDVGACRELILGSSHEVPPLGPGGAVTSLANPEETAGEIGRLLTNRRWYERCSRALKTRVERYYSKADLDQTYNQLYEELAAEAKKEVVN